MCQGFEAELRLIFARASTRRQTMLFSATLNSSLKQLEGLAAANTLRFDLTATGTGKEITPASLTQQYIFVPSQVKICYLVACIYHFVLRASAPIVRDVTDLEENGDGDGTFSRDKAVARKRKSPSSTGPSPSSSPPASVIIFVSTCKRCQLIAELLVELGVDCVALHSLMSQHRRAAALGKFKSQVSRILVATDIASRGLSIPSFPIT